MATILRTWSYQYQWLYDAIARLSALTVGGEQRFRQLALQGLEIQPETQVLDLCCGSGQTTQFLVERSHHVTGLDASPKSITRAQQNVPKASYVEGWAEAMPLADGQFDVVHTSVALHEMTDDQLQKIISEVHRVLKPGGFFTFIDLHQPRNPIFWPGLATFMWLFETETAWRFIQTDVGSLLTRQGFQIHASHLHAGGSLQIIQAQKT
ncbi:MAG: class I SAM-dependent methyltransferase [Leptolyngbyaceae bacterium]|nr:class I SAM-dependent methyltransferase [Leptolyngbyaceae bacterium]